MKITIQKDLIYEKLSIASRFISSKFSSIAALQGIYLVGKGNIIDIYSTNLNSYFHTNLKIKESAEFKVIIEPRKALELLGLLKTGEVDLDINPDKVSIIQGKTRASIPVIVAEEFPLPPIIKDKEQKVKKDFLLDDLQLVLFASSSDETRPVLTGVNFLTQDEELLIVATDGFRLSLLKGKKEININSSLIPRDFLVEVTRFAKEEEEISFSFSAEEKMIAFKAGASEVYSRLIDGEFPAFEKVLPSEKKTTITVDREELTRGVKLTSVFARDFSNIIIMDFRKDGLYIKPKTDVEGDNETFIEGITAGEEQKIAFNFKFVLDFLNHVESKNIIIELLRPDAPAVFKTEDNKNFLHVIMPIRIQQ